MRPDLAAIQTAFENDLNRVTEIASIRFSQAVKEQLDDWAARYPRHSFHAWEGHGMMSIDVSPPICGETSLGYLEPDSCRGAIACLAAEARDLIDLHVNSDQRISLYCDEHKTAAVEPRIYAQTHTGLEG